MSTRFAWDTEPVPRKMRSEEARYRSLAPLEPWMGVSIRSGVKLRASDKNF